MSLILHRISKRYSGARREHVGAVRDLSLTVRAGEFLVIVGPSGCGKTTTLRLIAGLENPDGGDIQLEGRSLAGVPPSGRDVAMVFQQHALLPHLTVFENMAFGLALRRTPRAEIERRVRDAAAMLGLEPLLERKPGALSGGECQRAALGRALVRQPKVFLFDEPLSDLDAPMRLQLRGQIAAVHRRSGGMTICVTHDQAEAMALADRIAVMRDGTLQQTGAPMELYRCPANRFVAGFIGSPPMNFFDGQLEGNVFRPASGEWNVVLPEAATGQRVTLGIRPEHITIGINGGVPAQFERMERGGAENFVYFSVAGVPVAARLTEEIALRPGDTARLHFEARHAVLFDSATGDAVASYGKSA